MFPKSFVLCECGRIIHTDIRLEQKSCIGEQMKQERHSPGLYTLKSKLRGVDQSIFVVLKRYLHHIKETSSWPVWLNPCRLMAKFFISVIQCFHELH